MTVTASLPKAPPSYPAAAERTIRIEGGAPLRGRVTVGGSKNLVLPALAASLLSAEPCVFDNVPSIEDTRTMLRLLKALGAEVAPDPDGAGFFAALREHKRVTVHAREIAATEVPLPLARAMRASFLVVAPLLARAGRAVAPTPGGDQIGSRPLDVALRGLEAMGARVEEHTGERVALSADRLVGGDQIYLDYPSHTGTEALLMAAALVPGGTTTIVNAACEPEVIAFGNMLRRMGAGISGLGSPHVTVEGVSRLTGASETIIPDRLVAGTYAIGAVITGGELTIQRVVAADMLPVSHKLREMGATVYVDTGRMFVRAERELRAVDVQALPFPGFPTDQQATFAALLTQARGTSNLHERVYEDRLQYVRELNKMGAAIEVDRLGVRAVIEGPRRLQGAAVVAKDIRAAAALVLAGLAAEGETAIFDPGHLARGYEDLVPQLADLGARITEA
ncbi:MAG: UDP-N-acetylglucosamine 1-carboxyvinyltransferase [Chloroflexota bacterium]|nr:UDP-N-acetylglucosamine 1-carboxyvinyltransferase [Chloroflexota bacterium]